MDAARPVRATPLRRDTVMEAVAFAAERLLLSPDWRSVVDEVLERLGTAVSASRASIIENADTSDGPLYSIIHEWCADGVPPMIDDPASTGQPWLSGPFAGWVAPMRVGEPLVAKTAEQPPEEQVELARQGIASVAYFPIQAEGRWWGCIGFDDCDEPRDWAVADLEGLRTAAAVLSAAITRTRQDERIREAENRYRSVVEQIPAVTYFDIVEPEGVRMGFLSPQIEALLGFPSERFLVDGDSWFELIHPDDRERVEEAGRRARDGTPFSEEYRMQTADGDWVWVHDTTTPVRDEAGTITHFQGFMIEISARKATEEQLRHAEERYRMIVEHTPAITYQEPVGDPEHYDAANVYTYVSPQIDRILGYPSDVWATTPSFWMQVVHPDDLQAVLELSSQTALTGEPYRQEYRMLAQDGRVVWFHDESHLIRDTAGQPLHWQGVMLDVTERKVAEAELVRTQARLEALIEHIPAVVYVQAADSSPERFYISPQVEQLLGYTAEEWTWTDGFWASHVHPADRERAVEEDRRTDADRDPYAMEYRFERKDGSYVWLLDEGVFVPTPGGDDGFWQGFLFDITERKEAEQQLREAEETFRTIVEQNPAVIYTQEFDEHAPSLSRTTYISPRQLDVFGYEVDEVLADPTLWSRMIHPEDRDRVLSADLASNEAREDRFSLEYRMIARDGRVVWVQDDAKLVEIPGRPPFWQGFLLDITERKHAEEQLARALDVEREATRRLRALDEMKNTFLQAVSHDLRTPLAAILGLAITLERGDVQLDEADAHDLARRIAGNARRLDRLVMNLLDLDRLARGIVTPKRERIDVGGLVRRVVSESELLSDARVRLEIEEVTISVDGAKVERIVENLLANTVRHTPASSTVWVKVSRVAEGAVIAVEDDGPGVEPEVRDSIFEPFRQGPDAPQHSPGVGVGLTLVRRFAELHGGRAWVEDRAGGGASFRVLLPAEPPVDAHEGRAVTEDMPAR